MAIYELLDLDREIRKMIVEKKSEDEIREYAGKNGLVTLREAALKKVTDGVTTVQEALGSTLL